MKSKLSLLILIAAHFACIGQTRDEDYDYIIAHYMNNANNANYTTKNLTTSTFQKTSDVAVTLEFVNFTSKADKKNRGTAIVYKEKKKNNQIINFIVLCIPEKSSDNAIRSKAFDALNSIDDNFVLKYIISGFTKIGLNVN